MAAPAREAWFSHESEYRVQAWGAGAELMDYSTAAAQLWRHHDLGVAASDAITLVSYATLAASSHNTQPWKFRLKRDKILILPDLSRRCPVVDPDDHHLYASLGCAAENLILAARAAGLEGHLSYAASDTCLRVDLKRTTPARRALFEAIPARQCSRAEYDGRELSTQELNLLEEASRETGVALVLLTSRIQKQQVAEYVAAGNTAQFADPAWARELRSWIRFNGHDAVRTGDGLYGPAMGNPSVPPFVGELFLRFAFSAQTQNRKDVAHIMSSAVIAVFVSDVDDKPHWVRAGRSCQRVALQAAALGLRTAFINQPVEVPALRAQFASFLDIGQRRPDLVLRVGRGPEMPRSLRRPIEQVLV